jgi:PPM family protein phosphatase
VSNTPETLRLEVGAISHQGLVRTENQDRYGRVASPFGEVIIVADGMGGHRGGATAAAMVVDGFNAHLQSIPPMTPVADSIQHAAQLTNADIHRKATDGDPDTAHMGATVVLAVVIGNQLIIGHAGDSRAYMYRTGQFTRLTRDHSFVQRMVDRNLLTEEQARDHPNANVVTRAFGQKPDIEFEISAPMMLQPGDRIMLCSDGLCGYVEDAAIEQAMSQPTSAQQIAQMLIELALAAGGEDNVTVQVLQLHAPVTQTLVVQPPVAPSPLSGPMPVAPSPMSGPVPVAPSSSAPFPANAPMPTSAPLPIGAPLQANAPLPPGAQNKSSGLKFVWLFVALILVATPVALHVTGTVRLWPLSASPDAASATAPAGGEAVPNASNANTHGTTPNSQGPAPVAGSSKPTNNIGFGPPPVVASEKPRKPVGITLPPSPLGLEDEAKRFTELRADGRKVAVILSAAIEGQSAGRFIYYRDDSVYEEAIRMADRLGYPHEVVKPFSDMPGELAKDFAGYDIVIRP